VLTSAAVCRSPIRPWFSISGYSSIGAPFRSVMHPNAAPRSA
jgi:hypothetical protein